MLARTRSSVVTLLLMALAGCASPTLHARKATSNATATPVSNPAAPRPVPVETRAPGLPAPISLGQLGGLGAPDVKAMVPAAADPPLATTTLAGTALGYADGAGAAAKLSGPTGVAVTGDGALLVADHNNHCLRRISLTDPTHPVTTLAGATTGGADAAGFADGDLKTARFHGPMGLAVGPDGTIYVADAGNHRVRMIIKGTVSTLAGSGEAGPRDGPGATAGFAVPTALALDGKGGLFVTDSYDNRIRRIDLSGATHQVTSIAGNGDQNARDGVGTAASFSSPFGLACDPQGNAIVADPGNRRLRKVTRDGTVTSLQTGPIGGDAPFQPAGIGLRPDGTLIVSDVGNNRLLAIPPAKSGAEPDTRVLAGPGQAGKGPSVSLNDPQALAIAPDGAIYLADTDNNRIQKFSPFP